jgi:hypothetical protein
MDYFAAARERMVDVQLRRRGIADEAVLGAFPARPSFHRS